MFSLHLHVRSHLRPLTWIALVAILSLALLPSLSHAFAHFGVTGAAGGWAEVCTPQGPKRIAIDADDKMVDTVVADADALTATHLQHCPLCALQTDAPPLPPAAASPLPLPLASDSPPAAFLHAPHTLHAWRSAQPRGPPASS